jgi:hypothetical protein
MVDQDPHLAIADGWSPLLVGGLAVILVLAAVVPLYVSERRVSQRQDRMIALLTRAIETEVAPAQAGDRPSQLLDAIRHPGDIRGFTRGLIALLIVAIIGVGLAVAMISAADDSPDIRKTIITSLTTVLATLAGFYFGSKSASNTPEDNRAAGQAGGSGTG